MKAFLIRIGLALSPSLSILIFLVLVVLVLASLFPDPPLSCIYSKVEARWLPIPSGPLAQLPFTELILGLTGSILQTVLFVLGIITVNLGWFRKQKGWLVAGLILVVLCSLTMTWRTSQSIRTYVCDESSAWGSVRVCVTVTDFAWNTSIFPDSKSGCYFLPVKKEVRRKLMLNAGDKVFGTLTIELNLDHEFD